MDITPRQLAFLNGLYHLVISDQAPVHYTRVAQHLGVNRYSAYDMLKVLEAKELAATDYVLSASKDGPGRSRVVFFPTEKGLKLLRQQGLIESPFPAASDEWTAFKDTILYRLQEARKAGSRELLQDLVARLPERRYPLHYCAQMVSALVLNLERARDRVAAVSPFDALEALTANGQESVDALAGLSLGSALMVEEASDPSMARQLLGQMQRFQNHLSGLNSDSRRRLSAFLNEVVRVYNPPTPATVSPDQP